MIDVRKLGGVSTVRFCEGNGEWKKIDGCGSHGLFLMVFIARFSGMKGWSEGWFQAYRKRWGLRVVIFLVFCCEGNDGLI